jgi:hypothetical protein
LSVTYRLRFLPIFLLASTDVLNGRVTLLTVGFVASYTIVLIPDRIILEGIRGVSFDKWLSQSSWEEELTLLGLRHPAITDGQCALR